MIVFLANQANSYVTGQQIIVDGRYTVPDPSEIMKIKSHKVTTMFLTQKKLV